MYRYFAAFFAFVLIATEPIRADEEPAEAGPSLSDWHYRHDLLIRINAFGSEPALIFSEDSPNRAVSGPLSPLRSEVRGRMRVRSRFVHIEIEPYTWVPQDGFYVTVAGVEYRLMTPLTERLRVGFYHHSSHNFSDGTYGRGISLNALVVDGELLRGEVPILGRVVKYRTGGFGHLYLPGSEGSAYEFAGRYAFEPSAAGRTTWRAGVDAEVLHPWGRGECSASAAAERWLPVSTRGHCQATFSPGRRFFGALGEHAFAGPFLAYRLNVLRHGEFGGPEIVGGAIFQLVAAENTF